MKALRFERSLARYAAARVASSVAGDGQAARVGPLSLVDIEEPSLPAPGWQRVRPRLAGICGSDLSTIDGHASRYFEPIVSFPFVPGHEVVGDLDDGRRVVLEPVLACAARGIDPPCHWCQQGMTGNCERVAFGHLEPGLQTGYCSGTGGGWSTALVAHDSQLHPVPDAMSDEEAVMVEPAACAVHAASARHEPFDKVVVLGAGTLGLCVVAALRRFHEPATVLVTAKHPDQRRLATEFGADVVVEPAGLRRAVRRLSASLMVGNRLAGGATVVIDCVGSAGSLTDALDVVAPRGAIVLVGMPGTVRVDLTSLWQREVQLVGAYTYGRGTFAHAFELVAGAGLGRLVSACYPLDRWAEAIDHAGSAGRRGAVKVAFDLRGERRR